MATKKSTTKNSTAKNSTEGPKRRYSSQLRERHALQTREQVLAAAAELFEESGWAGTTVAAIAERAGVAVETIYSGFGSKKHLLRAVLDFAVVGDAEPVPLVEREVFATLATGNLDERLTAGLEMLIDIQERVAKLWRTAMEAAASDAEIDGWRSQWDEGRRIDTRRSLELILRCELDDVMLDLLWGILSHEVYGMLVLDRGLDRAQYAERMRTAVTALAPA
ncbi:MAG TPA: helix-turn-helix domain-containing protein, partial [Acidimicrobiia bacterium]|nr:helix-turn-helix domain-containing protein [Acidimicrobiia bacterium]